MPEISKDLEEITQALNKSQVAVEDVQKSCENLNEKLNAVNTAFTHMGYDAVASAQTSSNPKNAGDRVARRDDPAKRLLLFLAGFLAFSLAVIIALINGLLTSTDKTATQAAVLFCCDGVDLYKHTLRWVALSSGIAVVFAFLTQVLYKKINKSTNLFIAISVIIGISLLILMTIIILPHLNDQICFW